MELINTAPPLTKLKSKVSFLGCSYTVFFLKLPNLIAISSTYLIHFFHNNLKSLKWITDKIKKDHFFSANTDIFTVAKNTSCNGKNIGVWEKSWSFLILSVIHFSKFKLLWKKVNKIIWSGTITSKKRSKICSESLEKIKSCPLLTVILCVTAMELLLFIN